MTYIHVHVQMPYLKSPKGGRVGRHRGVVVKVEEMVELVWRALRDECAKTKLDCPIFCNELS